MHGGVDEGVGEGRAHNGSFGEVIRELDRLVGEDVPMKHRGGVPRVADDGLRKVAVADEGQIGGVFEGDRVAA